MQRHDLFRSHSRHAQHFNQARLHICLELFVIGQTASAIKGGDFFHQRVAKARQFAQRPRLNPLPQIVLERGQVPSAILVSTHLKGIFARQFEQRPNFLQHGSDGSFVHERTV